MTPRPLQKSGNSSNNKLSTTRSKTTYTHIWHWNPPVCVCTWQTWLRQGGRSYSFENVGLYLLFKQSKIWPVLCLLKGYFTSHLDNLMPVDVSSQWLICTPSLTFSRRKEPNPPRTHPLPVNCWTSYTTLGANFLFIHKRPASFTQTDWGGGGSANGRWTSGACWRLMEEMTESVSDSHTAEHKKE